MSTSTRRRKPAEPAYHHGDLRRALIDATAAIVARDGAAGVTLREVARAAGVSHNAPYRHFESLAALLAAVAAQGFEVFGARLRKAADAAIPRERASALGRAYLDFALENPRLYLLMFGPALDKAEHRDLQKASQEAFAVLQGETEKAGGGHTEAIGSWAFVHGLAHLILDKQIRRNDPAIGELLAGRRPLTRA